MSRLRERWLKEGVNFRLYVSAITSGGIFAIRKDWWDLLEMYDPGMWGWGGDQIEAPFKVWRCGGRFEIVPCSRIGHLANSKHMLRLNWG